MQEQQKLSWYCSKAIPMPALISCSYILEEWLFPTVVFTLAFVAVDQEETRVACARVTPCSIHTVLSTVMCSCRTFIDICNKKKSLFAVKDNNIYILHTYPVTFLLDIPLLNNPPIP